MRSTGSITGSSVNSLLRYEPRSFTSHRRLYRQMSAQRVEGCHALHRTDCEPSRFFTDDESDVYLDGTTQWCRKH